MSIWERVYLHSLHHPGAAWLSAALVLGVMLRRLPFFYAFIIGAVVVSAADAMITGGWSQLGGQAHPSYVGLSWFFVLAGDYRVFLLLERYRRARSESWSGGAGVWWRALGWTLIASVVVGLISVSSDLFNASARRLYLTYELVALGVVALVWRVRVLGAMPPGDPVRRWLSRVAIFVMVQYALWAGADVVILAGLDVGHLLRMIPNLMYYALFLPVVLLSAPPLEDR
ncbi:hypothetical protein DV096_14935 [Bradymonadaceae bacterium TMQ3]|uniref:Uncharacterized protein n=1 Tax=Lujinxingia sediminis TaxID=2480984 RepID=A0ABY0CUN1_9DELT|nr:hypothetical protein [Lujinxingia sediminis]RDV37272.1 hypothetical protein DV096_14935 [Bradymonadaceae bacterium TMQ3]RVU46781.1 hypothetical protein EA187_06500 [Lujinxingia sediminis]TXC74791.1 hypothetical protein FRC91_14645 [Bradymonadales bacterium TMQ1]